MDPNPCLVERRALTPAHEPFQLLQEQMRSFHQLVLRMSVAVSTFSHLLDKNGPDKDKVWRTDSHQPQP